MNRSLALSMTFVHVFPVLARALLKQAHFPACFKQPSGLSSECIYLLYRLY